jgi:hypothetical protein
MRLFSRSLWLWLAGSFSTLRAPARAVAMKNFVPATHTQSASKFFPFGFCRIEHKMYVSVCVWGGKKRASASFPSGALAN